MSIACCDICGQYVDTDFYPLYLEINSKTAWAVCESCYGEYIIDDAVPLTAYYRAWSRDGMAGLEDLAQGIKEGWEEEDERN